MERLYSFKPFKWIDECIEKTDQDNWQGYFVKNCVPKSFESYCKLLHPIYEDTTILNKELLWNDTNPEDFDGNKLIGKRVLWEELAKEFNLVFHEDFNYYSFNKVFNGYWPRYLVGPEEGSLEIQQTEKLITALRQFTKNQECYFYYDFLAADMVEELLFKGSLSDVLKTYNIENVFGSPTYWWPQDKSWCVCTDWDLTFTIIGGSKDLISTLKKDSILECVEVTPNSRVDYKADSINK